MKVYKIRSILFFGFYRCILSTSNAVRAIENLALLRKIAFNFTKLDPAMQNKTVKKKMIDYMTDISLFKKLIFEVIPTKL